MRARAACLRNKAPAIGAFFYALFCLAAAGGAVADAGFGTRVRAAIDGDTLLLADGRLVRLIGINAPELAAPPRRRAGSAERPARERDEPLARAAQARLAALVRDGVELQTERERHDRYGRLLAHARLATGDFAAEILVREGLAFAIAVPPNVERARSLFALEGQARAAGRGVWGEPYFAAWTPTPLTAASAGTGFRRVRGRIAKVVTQPHGWYLQLTSTFSLYIPRADGAAFASEPTTLSGRMVEARGWVTHHGGRYRLKVEHPAMIVLEPPSAL